MSTRTVTERLARAGGRRRRLVIGGWALAILASAAIIAAFLPSALTTEDDFTGNPESQRAEQLLHSAFPPSRADDRRHVDEVVIVSSRGLNAKDPAFRRRVNMLAADLRMPPSHTDEGLRAARAIRERWPAVGILVLSQFARPSYAFELLQIGTEGIGYLLKDRVADLAALADGVRRVAARESVLDPSVVGQLVGRPRPGRDPLVQLTDREREVLGLMAEGRSNRAVAEEELVITEHTVEKHVTNIMGKLQIPASADDHRRVLAVLTFLGSD